MSITTLAPLFTITLGVGLYQICLKRLPQFDYPFHVLALIYTLSAALSLALAQVFPSKTDALQVIREGHVGVIVLGVTPVVIEVGYLWAFRWGWRLGALNVVVSVMCAVLMLAVGYVLFRESVSALQLAGVVLGMISFFLVIRF